MLFRSNFYVKSVSGTEPERLVYQSTSLFKNVADWSPDGKTWLVNQLDSTNAQNIYTVPASGGALTTLTDAPLREVGGRYSRDGKWVVYASDGSGQFEVMVQSVPPVGQPIRVASGGGGWFSADGRAIVGYKIGRAHV